MCHQVALIFLSSACNISGIKGYPEFRRYSHTGSLMKRVFVATLVAASIAASSGCDNAQQRQEKYVTQGTSYLADGNLEKARISFKNALQINPENAEAKLKFAEVLERLDDFKGAYGQYLSVLEKDANNIVALERQGKILMMAGETDKALENAEKLLSTQGADFAPGLLLKAGALAKTNKLPEALKLAERVVSVDPKNLEAAVLLSSLYIRQTDYPSAETQLRNAIAGNPSVSGLKIMLVDVLNKQGKAGEVEAILRSLTKDEPDRLQHFMQLAKYLQMAKRPDEALAVMQEFVTAHADDKSAKLALVQLTDVAKNVDEGDRVLAGFITKNPAVYELQFAQVQRLLARKKNDEAIAGLQTIVDKDKTGNDGLQARLLLAQIKVANKDLDGAKVLINDIVALNASDLGALALRGRIALQEHRYTDAISDLRTVVKERADDLQSQLLLATAHIENNESELAVELLQKTVKLYPRQRNVRLMLADLLSKKGDADGAIAQYRDLLDQKADDNQALIAIAKLYQATDKRDELTDIAGKMLANKETMAVGFYYQGVLKLKENQHEEARELFEKSLAVSPSAIEPVSALVQSYLAQKQWKAAASRLDKLLASQPGNSTFHNLKAEALLAGNDTAGAQSSLKKVIELSPAWWVPYRTLAGLLWYQKDKPGAERLLKQGIEATGNNPVLRMELASQLERNGKIDESIAVYRQMIEDGQDGEAVINNLAMLLTTKSDAASLDAAKNYSEKLAQSQNPLFLDTAGWVRLKRGEYEAALPILKRAVELAPKHSQIRYHLGFAYFKNNQMQEAKDNLALALEGNNPFDGRAEAQRVLQELQKS
jgi:tetratricopeptide (TPR) repeat protein